MHMLDACLTSEAATVLCRRTTKCCRRMWTRTGPTKKASRYWQAPNVAGQLQAGVDAWEHGRARAKCLMNVHNLTCSHTLCLS